MMSCALSSPVPQQMPTPGAPITNAFFPIISQAEQFGTGVVSALMSIFGNLVQTAFGELNVINNCAQNQRYFNLSWILSIGALNIQQTTQPPAALTNGVNVQPFAIQLPQNVQAATPAISTPTNVRAPPTPPQPAQPAQPTPNAGTQTQAQAPTDSPMN